MSGRFYIDPADTVIVRDGRPFNQGDAGRSVAASLFPPPPDTIYGVARVAAAHMLGWPGTGDWTNPSSYSEANAMQIAKQCESLLGNRTSQGEFAVGGPYFSVGENVTLWPIPAHVIARTRKSDGSLVKIQSLMPSAAPMATDMGEARLLIPPEHDPALKDVPLAGRWASAAGIRKLLEGQDVSIAELTAGIPSVLMQGTNHLPGLSLDDIAIAELRIGIERNLQTRLAEDGRLYLSARRRLNRGVRMFVDVECENLKLIDKTLTVPIGGEARFAFVEAVASTDVDQTKTPPTGRYLLYFKTPVAMQPPRPGDNFGAFGTVVSAAIAGVEDRSGFVFGKGKTESVPVLPAGTVFFMDSTGAASNGAAPFGGRAHMGYGRFSFGLWKEG